MNQDNKKYVLIGFAAVAIIFLLVFFGYSGSVRVKRGGSGPTTQELEDYKKIQPF